MSKNEARWRVKTTPLGTGLQCSNCEHILDARDIIFGSIKYDVCPNCGKVMIFDEDEDIEPLKSYAKENVW
jgi:predicted RNA-binding Zn-ribbon protein involved in translation (DUF1610 family)